MELRSIGGIPAHPLLVHAVVVLLPLAAIVLVAAALLPRFRRVLAPVALVFAVISFGSAFFAEQSGETLEHQVKETDALEEHTEGAEAVMPFALLVVLVSGAATAVAFAGDRIGEKVPAKAVTGGLVVLALLSGVGATATVISAGHSGAKAVWGDTANNPVRHEGGERDGDGD